jgi:hypothetical protein
VGRFNAVKLPRWIRRGARRDGDERPFTLIAAEDSLRTHGLLELLLAVGLCAFVLVMFDWRAWDVVYGTATGIVLWGLFYGLLDVSDKIPSSESLPLAPADVTIDRAWNPRRLLVFPLFFALAWLADRVDLGATFVPGQLAGAAVADLVGLVLVRRWQRDHETQVLLRWGESGEPELYSARRGLP